MFGLTRTQGEQSQKLIPDSKTLNSDLSNVETFADRLVTWTILG